MTKERKPRVQLALGGALALTALVGCDGFARATAATATDAAMRVDTIDGVVHVQHTGRAPVANPTMMVAVGEAGGLDEASPAEFGRVRSVMADGDGRFYVADAHALEVRVFEADGTFARALGRKGAGPGEMEGLHGTAWLTPDTLVVVDFGNARLGLMDREGRHVGQWPWMPATGSIRFFHPVGEGEIYAHGIRRTGEGDGERQRVESVWVRYGVDGPVDTLAIPQPAAPAPGGSAVCRGDGIGFFTNPHAARLLSAPAPGADRVVAMSSEYRLTFLDPAGDTVRVLTRDADAVPLSDDDWRATAEQYDEFQRRWRGAACEGDIRRPAHRPVLRDIAFDHHGRLLVEINTPDGPALDIFDGDWGWLATVPLPERDPSVPVFIRDDRLYTVARDTLGVQRVEVHALETRPAG